MAGSDDKQLYLHELSVAAASVREVLHQLGVLLQHPTQGFDPEAEGLKDTPMRVAKALYYDFLSGYREDPNDVFTTFDGEAYDELIAVSQIPFYSMCEHHMVPFHGHAHVAYVPSGRIVGLSKLARVVDIYGRRLQVQERLTNQVADCIEDNLSPLGTMVVVEAEHLCMAARGIRKPGAVTTTSAVRGVFKDPAKGARAEFLTLIKS